MKLLLIIVGGGTLRWRSILSKRGTPTPIRFMAKREIQGRTRGLNADLTCQIEALLRTKRLFSKLVNFLLQDTFPHV